MFAAGPELKVATEVSSRFLGTGVNALAAAAEDLVPCVGHTSSATVGRCSQANSAAKRTQAAIIQ